MTGCSSGCGHDHHDDVVQEAILVIVGKIGAPFGIQGWQHIHSYTNPVDNILQYENWYVRVKDEWLALSLIEGRKHGQGIVAHLSEIDNPETASLFTNCEIAIERDALATLPENEFYWTDLEGLAVQTQEGESLGHVLYLYENAQTDVMVVKNQQKERHIPFVMHDTVLSVDFAQEQIIVDWDSAL
ncbi:MAG: ribosome maturation factor RimM [Gammaproteobacteria bacterium]|jgi:16S rRNA processing protein RimM|nr:ribosome maturation factor RimM [Gammaproteobacteria bacterium]